jgi:hypothetical protein
VRQNTTETQLEAMIETREMLDQPVREGARKMLQGALEVEIQEHLERFEHVVDAQGKRQVPQRLPAGENNTHWGGSDLDQTTMGRRPNSGNNG